MNVILFWCALVSLALGLSFLLLFRKLNSKGGSAMPCRPEALNPARYKPMERLLDEEDFRFLAGHPGADPKLVRRLRSERRRLFRGYLRCLERDFNRIYGTIQLVLVESQQDRPELAAALLKQRILFSVGVLAVEARLMLHVFGWATVDVRNLVEAVDSMRVQLGQLVPATGAATA